MKNKEVAQLLEEIADILELKGEDRFKTIAYRRAASTIETLEDDIAVIAKEGKLEDIPHVGRGIAPKIQEFLEADHSAYLEMLEKQLPSGLVALMNIPGLGPKRIQVLNKKLKINNKKDLQAAIAKHRIRKLAGFGEKSEQDIAKGLELVQKGMERSLLGYTLPTALQIEKQLKKLKQVKKISIAGSLRRRQETVGDIDILVAATDAEKIMTGFTKMANVSRILANGSTKSSVIVEGNMQVDLRVVPEKSFGAALQYFSGNKEHNVALRHIAMGKGYKLNEYGVFRKKDNRILAGKTETEVYKVLGFPYIEPELRQNNGELEAAKKHKLPDLIPYGSIKGDLHTHTNKSDGSNTTEEMVAAAKKLGREYIAITDHSKSQRIANGLSEAAMQDHHKKIRASIGTGYPPHQEITEHGYYHSQGNISYGKPQGGVVDLIYQPNAALSSGRT